MLINCQNCQKIVSSYREICPHCQKKAIIKNKKKLFSRFTNIFIKEKDGYWEKNWEKIWEKIFLQN